MQYTSFASLDHSFGKQAERDRKPRPAPNIAIPLLDGRGTARGVGYRSHFGAGPAGSFSRRNEGNRGNYRVGLSDDVAPFHSREVAHD